MTPLQLYLDFVVFVFGAVVGSFLNVCVHRMPREQSIVAPPSHCPHCKEPIRWFDNIPLVSYLLLRGRCRHCRARITPRYFVVELLTGILFLLVWLRLTRWTAQPVEGIEFLKGPIYWLVVAGLIAATFIDFEHYIIPNELTVGGIVAGLALSGLYPQLMGETTALRGLMQSGLGILVGGLSLYLIVEIGKLVFGRLKIPLQPGTVIRVADRQISFGAETMNWDDIFFRASDQIRFRAVTLRFLDKTFQDVDVCIRESTLHIGGENYKLAELGPVEATAELVVIPREAMGFGDVKLLAAIGAFLGWKATLFTLFFSSVAGGAISIVLVACGQRDLRGRIPYGPYIALGAVVWILCGTEIVNGYINLITSPAG